MDETYPNSERFWAFLLPLMTALTIVCSVTTEHLSTVGENLLQSKVMMSAVVLGLFSGSFSILAFRAIIYNAIDNHRRMTVGMLSGASLIICIGYICYGIHTIVS